jgi:hypothetical protein
MSEGPRFPTEALVSSLACLADMVALIALWTSSGWLVLKAAVTAAAVLIPWTIIAFYLGRCQERKALVKATDGATGRSLAHGPRTGS